MKADTAATHQQRILQALAYIEAHLDEALCVAKLARRFGFSPYHFHRVFRQQVGESPYRYLQRLRLERAAFRLKRGGESVTELSGRAGYRTHEAFTRAFRSEFGTPPIGYRDRPDWSQGRAAGPPAIVRLPERHVAFVRHVGPYTEAGQAFAALRAWARPRGLLKNATVLGMPRDHKQVTAPEHLRYDLGVVIDPNVTDTAGVAVRVMRGGAYARVCHRGPYEDLDHTYDFLYATWIPAEGYRSADLPPFEIYVDNPAVTPREALRTDVYVPLEPNR